MYIGSISRRWHVSCAEWSRSAVVLINSFCTAFSAPSSSFNPLTIVAYTSFSDWKRGLTLSNILRTIWNHLLPGDTVLHIYIGPPPWELRLKLLISGSFLVVWSSTLPSSTDNCLLTQSLGVVEATFLLTMLGPEAVGRGANSVPLACGNELAEILLIICHLCISLVADVRLCLTTRCFWQVATIRQKSKVGDGDRSQSLVSKLLVAREKLPMHGQSGNKARMNDANKVLSVSIAPLTQSGVNSDIFQECAKVSAA